MPEKPTAHILIVDDDAVFCERLARSMRRRGFATSVAASHAQAITATEDNPGDMAVIDLRLGPDNGLELIRDLLAIAPDMRIVMLTGYGSIATAIDATRLGAVNFIQKPADADDILAAFERGERPPLSEARMDYTPPSLARAEWEHIQRVLADCGGNISHTARALGIHRRTLQRKLDAFPPND